MRRNGGMGWRETRKGLTSFRSLLALSPLCSYPRFFLSLSLSFCHSVLLRISLVSTPFPFCVPSASLPWLFTSFLSIYPSRHRLVSPARRSSASNTRSTPRRFLLRTVSTSPPPPPPPRFSLPFIIHRQEKFIYVLAVILNSRFTISRISPFFLSFLLSFSFLSFFFFVFFVFLFVGAACLMSGALLLRLASLSLSFSLSSRWTMQDQLFVPPPTSSSSSSSSSYLVVSSAFFSPRRTPKFPSTTLDNGPSSRPRRSLKVNYEPTKRLGPVSTLLSV